MARLPKPGGDTGAWGDILNNFLSVEHNDDGSLKSDGSLGTKYTKPAGGIPETDLASSVQTKLNSSTGVIADGSITEAQLATAVQTKLDQTAPVQSVAGKTGVVTLVKADVGLTQVDNTADADKPVSTATQTALSGKANLVHTHAISDVTGLQTALDDKQPVGSYATTTDLSNGLATKAALVHTHTVSQISDATATGQALVTATDAAAARTAIGAGSSDLALGTTSTTAKAGNYAPSSADISDATAVGRGLLTAVDAATARTAIGAGNSSLVIGTTSTTAKAGDYAPSAANISDATTIGRNLLTAVDAPTARTAIGAGTSSVVIGTTTGTAADAATTTTAITAKADASALAAHTSNVSNPHAVTKAQVGLGNATNVALLVLGPSDPIPGGTPAGTVVVRTT